MPLRSLAAKFRVRLLSWGPAALAVIAVALGSVAGLFSAAFWNAISALQSWASYYLVAPLNARLPLSDGAITWAFLSPALGGLAVGILATYVFRSPERLGVPAVMLDARQSWGRIPARYIPATFVNSTITIGSGGSAGREAPVVAMGGALGALLARRLAVPPVQRRLLVGCGVAAAIAAAFNAPLAGVFFALEVILGDWRAGTLAPVMLASVAGTVVARATEGSADASHFSVPAYHLAAWWEVFFYAGLGVVAGVVAQPFARSVRVMERAFARVRQPWRPAIGGLAVGVLGLGLPEILGNGYPWVIAALNGNMPLILLLVLPAAKILATALTLGSGGWGGDFAPILYIGAMTGGAYGWLLAAAFPGQVAGPGAYAMVAMGALLAAVVRCPITAVMLLFELTGSYEVILPIMVAVAAAVGIARLFVRPGLYHEKLEELGGPAFEMRADDAFAEREVGDAMRTAFATVAEATPLVEMINIVRSSPQLVFPVVRPDGDMRGAIRITDLRAHFLGDMTLPVVAAELAVNEVPVLTPETPLAEAAALLAATEWEELPVVESRSRCRPCGLISRHDIVLAALGTRAQRSKPT